MRSRGTEAAAKLGRDLIEAGLSEPAGWRARYGDCVAGDMSEAPDRPTRVPVPTGRWRLAGAFADGWKQPGG